MAGSAPTVVPASFRDRAGFVFFRDGQIYRQVNRSYQADYDQLIQSGLYQTLVQAKRLVSHEEIDLQHALSEEAYRVLKPATIPFISYPYEWCFSQLKHAALFTLDSARQALEFGMMLKDASPFNIQFKDTQPLFIDTLSFERYTEGQPWIAYRQFCQHFLAPLALTSYVDARLQNLTRIYLDGIPLDLASALLPFRTRLNFGLVSHLHLHARAQKHITNQPAVSKRLSMGRHALLGLIDSLSATVDRLQWRPASSDWGDYYESTNYSQAALKHKKQLVAEMLAGMTPRPTRVWDLGANTGLFSQIAGEQGAFTVAFDSDPLAVERHYLNLVAKRTENILPLVLDVTNPSSGTGWENRERMSLAERGPADVVLALALLHHLAIAHNLRWNQIAAWFSRISRAVIIEFIPKSDSQVQRLLQNRRDIFDDYTQAAFEDAFGKYFEIVEHYTIAETSRMLYRMVNPKVV